MRRLPLIFIVLFFITGCSSTGRVVINQDTQQENGVALRENAVKSEEPEKREGVVKQANIKPKKNVLQNIDDEDDIASLLGHQYAKNFDIPIVFNDAVKYFILYFTTEKRKVFGNWLRRARYYVPIIKEILKEKGLPEDLVYLAMIESGFNPKAYSPAKASGPWQFIYETGGRYGLRVSYWIDERRDPEKSTIAAAKYLKDLFNQFGHWYLAAAGYNAGEKRVERAIERHNTNDFWELVKYNALPKETREHIPKLIAAAIIAKDPEKFGFGSIAYDQPIKFMEVQVPAATPLTAIAKAASVDIDNLRSMNPEILRGITPPDIHSYAVKLPYSVNRNNFVNNLEIALSNEKRIKDVSEYKVRKGDTLAKIAKKYRITADDVLLVNNSGDEIKVKPGMIISIPRFVAELTTEANLQKSEKNKTTKKTDMKVVSGKPDTEKKGQPKTYHVVKEGETLTGISNKYGIDVASIRSVNELKTDKLYPNMKLRLASHTQKKEKKPVKYHIVKKGETLTAISNKYGIDVASIRSINKLKNNKVHPNMKLKIVAGEGKGTTL